MAYTRFIGNGWERVKSGATILFRSSPAILKVIASAGLAAFGAIKFSGWVLKKEEPLDHPLTIALGVTCALSVGVDNLVCRGFNMYRRENQPTPPTPLQITSQDAEPPAEAMEEGNSQLITVHPHPLISSRSQSILSYPGTENLSCMMKASYIGLQIFAIFYMLNASSSGYLGAFALSHLVATIFSQELNTTCEGDPSPLADIIIIHLLAFSLVYSVLLSLIKYMLPRLREYFNEYIIEKHWHDIGWGTYLESFIGTTITTACIAFTNLHTLYSLRDNTLCRLGVTTLPDFLTLFQTIVACGANFIINGAMTIVAVHKRNTDRMRDERFSLLELVPSFKPWDKLILACLILSSVSSGLGTVVAIAMLPEAIDRENVYLSQSWLMRVLGTLGGGFIYRNTRAVTLEGYVQELRARAPIAALPRLASAAQLSLSSSREETTTHTHYSVLSETEISPRQQQQERISQAPSATLFGERNPANLNALQIENKEAEVTIRSIAPQQQRKSWRNMCAIM
jgi:hypothetical protein